MAWIQRALRRRVGPVKPLREAYPGSNGSIFCLPPRKVGVGKLLWVVRHRQIEKGPRGIAVPLALVPFAGIFSGRPVLGVILGFLSFANLYLYTATFIAARGGIEMEQLLFFTWSSNQTGKSRMKGAVSSGRAVLMNIPVPSSKPAAVTRRGRIWRCQW